MNLGRIAIVAQGSYSLSRTYKKLDTVEFNGSMYVALMAIGEGESPIVQPTKWMLGARAGKDFKFTDFTQEQIELLQAPANDAIALVDAAVERANDAAQNALSGIKGTATQTNAPTAWVAGDPDLFEKWEVTTPITATSAWGIEVTQDMLDENNVFFYVINGSISIDSKPILKGADGENIIPIWEDSTKIFASGLQIIHLSKIWQSNDAVIATDIPGTSPKWVEVFGNALNDFPINYLPDFATTTTTGYQFEMTMGYCYFDDRVKFKADDEVVFGIWNEFAQGGKLVFFQKNGTTATELYVHTFTGNGVQRWDLSDIAYDFSAVVGYIYVGVRSVNSPYAIYAFKNGTNGGYYDDATKVIVSTPSTKTPNWVEITSKESYKDIIDDISSSSLLPSSTLEDILNGNGLFEGKAYTTSIPLLANSNTTYKGERGKTIIKFTGTGNLFTLNGSSRNITFENITFDGNTAIAVAIMSASDVKNLVGIGSNSAFYINGYVKNINFINCTFINWNGWAMKSTLTHQIYAESMKFSGNIFMYNYGGSNFDVRSEYHQLSQNTFAYNKIGCSIEGGNVFGNTNHFNGNGVGLILRGTTNNNDTHGSISTSTFNHNLSFALFCIDVNNGFSFNGCHFYDGKIYLENSRGVAILGGIIDAEIAIVNERVDGMNIISNNIFAGTTGVTGSQTTLSMHGNRRLTAASSTTINNSI